jgi:3-deoxy-D-manno-octulosonic-acid transferase
MWPAGLALFRHPNFRGTILSRLGLILPPVSKGRPVIWIHAASMGEVKAVSGLIKALKKIYPDRAVFLSSMTAIGRQMASSIPELDHIFPLPFDSAWVMGRYFRKLSPSALLIVETELWPNMILSAHKHGVPVVVVNARMTERSFRRYSLVRGVARKILGNVSVLAMAEKDSGRFARLGVGNVKTLGNLKLDSIQEVDLGRRSEMRDRYGIQKRPVFIAGSIREGEEPFVMEAVRHAAAEIPSLMSILVPRHPDQVGLLSELAKQSGLVCCLKSRFEYGTDVIIVDTMGELFNLYGASDVAFVGGSLVNLGGQNILEPIAWGIPTLHGPHMDNFIWALEIVEGFTIQVRGPGELGDAIVDIAVQPEKYYDLAQEARYLLEKRRGITGRYVDALDGYLR